MKKLYAKRSFVFLIMIIYFLGAAAQTNPGTVNKKKQPVVRDGQHDFDFEIGTWKTDLKVLLNPLTDSAKWVSFKGTSVVRKILNGKANVVELTVSGQAGSIEGLSLRLYNPHAHQWSLNFSNIRSGILSTAAIGEFINGRGEFYNQETINSRAVLVKFIISPVNSDTCRFEQSYSDDGGKTWETNWIAVDTRLKE
ncbi:hypothetical protein [Parafilimonas sp.]|uniref:hypothetical protein n=1 Tax=Parafilimonas sp. TaxID=1969739 RepID=UPI003F8137B6